MKSAPIRITQTDCMVSLLDIQEFELKVEAVAIVLEDDMDLHCRSPN
jgi:hypothetical protein